MINVQEELVYLKGFAKGKGLLSTLRAINAAIILHQGQKRKTGEDYIIHPIRVASELNALGIEDDIVLATAILHDVLEDSKITEEELLNRFKIDKKVIENVKVLTKKSEIHTSKYYENISNNPDCLIVKISDRCHNISTMVGAFSEEKIAKYLEETENYVIPLCKYGKNFYPQYSNQIYVMRYHIESICTFARIIIKKQV